VAGGGGGRSGSSMSREERDKLREQVLEDLRRQEQDAALNELVGKTLASFNDRDVDLIRERLETIQDALGDIAPDIDRLFFGGSVAKHTYVDGLSDVDALVVVNAPDASPQHLMELFQSSLKARLRSGDVRDVQAGRMAVTVYYRDGTAIQLLPAVERGGRTAIASADRTGWQYIRPHKFAEKLTQVNQANGHAVVPTIKLVKSVLRNLPENQRLSGYHVEAIAVDAFRSYSGRRDRASMLAHLVRHATQAVLKPTGDITGQSVNIDAHLGPAGSSQRQQVSSSLGRIAAALERRSPDEYKRLLDD
jgi:hypothetical protein